MQNITSTADLKNAIQLIEVEQAENGQLLKKQFYTTYESIKPVNLIKGTLRDIVSTPNLIDNVLDTVIGLASGYLTKRLVVGASGNIFRRLFGSMVQLGITNVVTQHPEGIKSIGHYIIQHIFRKKIEARRQKTEIGR